MGRRTLSMRPCSYLCARLGLLDIGQLHSTMPIADDWVAVILLASWSSISSHHDQIVYSDIFAVKFAQQYMTLALDSICCLLDSCARQLFQKVSEQMEMQKCMPNLGKNLQHLER